MKGLVFFPLVLMAVFSSAQTCTTAGQNPSTAFPVCGTSTFVQTSVPICGGRALPFKGCQNDGLTDINPFWYKFTCFQSGSLGFLITPNDLHDDYDWELYDITNRNTNDVYSDSRLVISNNWSGEVGLTGASTAGRQAFVCGGVGKALFSSMPQLQVGHNYLLLVSHFTQSQSGYKLVFGNGTAVITDPADPHLQKVEANCGGDVLRLRISKNIKCNSIAANGSDFFITPSMATVTGSTGINCSTQFDTDSLHLQLSTYLPPGHYTLHIKKGGDNNTLLDYCDHAVTETESLPFTILSKAPTPMDSIGPLTCAPSQMTLVFKKPMLCSSIAADGSDFSLSGSYPITVKASSGNCINGTTKEVIVSFDKTLQTAGNFQLLLKKGSDGNTLLDECGEETAVGSTLSFSVKDTVDASFTYAIGYGCIKDSVNFFHPALHDVNYWRWELDENQKSSLQNPQALYAVFDAKKVTLVVSNGFCSDTSEQIVKLENYLQADFSVEQDNCPSELIPFTNMAKGKIKKYSWDFGDGGMASIANPLHAYAVPFRQRTFSIWYTVTDSFNCKSTARKNITIYSSCYLAVPTAFTPNNDGLNDVFGVLNAVKAVDLEFRVFDRWGQLVFQTTNWKKTWDGKVKGVLQPSSVFAWVLHYTNRDTKKRVEEKGTVTLIR